MIDDITDDQIRQLWERHCECRTLDGPDLTMGKDDHAAIHDCDTGTGWVRLTCSTRWADPWTGMKPA